MLKSLWPYMLLWLMVLTSSSCEAVSFPELNGITKIVVTNVEGKTIHEVDDPQQVLEIVRFVNNNRSGWDAPSGDVPVPQVIANLYSDKTFVGHFGAGRDFFETHRRGDFYSKRVPKEEVEKFLKLIGINENKKG